MHALKSQSFFRPSSRPSSPAPGITPPSRSDSGTSLRESRPRTKLSLSTFRKPSPAPLIPVTPATLIQDGSYLDALSLKLSEGVSKALAQPSGATNPTEILNGRRPIPAGRGKALGNLIASEFNASKDNAHLRRAVLRALQRPLSVLLTNISTDLLPLLSSSAFVSPPAPTIQAPNPNATQSHALALANFAGELLETFDELGLGLESDNRGDNLKSVREGLASVVHRVVNPLVTGIKNDLARKVEELERPGNAPGAVLKGGAKTALHPSIAAMQPIMLIYAKALMRYTPTGASQSSLASLIISIVWRGLVAISHRADIAGSSPTSSPPSPFLGVSKKRRGSSTTPPITPPASRFTMKLPPSRPPSPPALLAPPSPVADARALYELLNMLPRPAADKKATRIAREAVDEAFDGLKALVSLLEAVQANGTHVKTGSVEELEKDLDVLTAGLPLMIALPVLLRAYVYAPKADAREPVQVRTVASMVGLSEDEYRKGCLAGYGRAEDCEVTVGERVYNALRKDAGLRAQSESGHEAVLLWLEGRINREDD
ncbi:hypothetical protein NEOLEDRAFT_1062564 [Neolentinus lepideus HHB14362 ss-1]|uniref:Uncharacterized protein n=1 Tax=Neolentinus lepideus HHB14362 ss-1 TaxID=1314782 RepID=A0A165TKG3_9AGAM|nr:hypothetical protein NEOLEDRAFT_1062564 [Neolentinus lepideus HHB14362 ss-1]